MDLLLIFIFFIILIIIITYTGIELKNYITNNIKYTTIKTGFLYKRWGCCPDKLTTKLDPQGSNCRGF
jgi:hypothetical protein